MNEDRAAIIKFLTGLGFSIVCQKSTHSSGDFVIEACSRDFCIMGVRDRTVSTIELRALSDPEEWFIMPIVVSFILRKNRLVEETSLEEQIDFVENNFDEIGRMFDEVNYPNVKFRLKELAQDRGKMLFPKWSNSSYLQCSMNITICRFDTIDSTNSEAAKQAKLGADEGLCIIARQQTAGRGRHGRTWVSAKDAGLYFSIVLRPKIEMRYLPLITLMTGVAVYDALTAFGLKPDIKWVNDILISDKKICGILAETVETPAGLAVIVGIGINLTSQNFPDEIAETATSVETMLSTKITTDEVETALTKYLRNWYSILCGENGRVKILDEWQRRSSYFSGKSVRVTLENEIFDGVTDGLEENGALKVKTSDGSVKIVQAGDVERLREVRS